MRVREGTVKLAIKDILQLLSRRKLRRQEMMIVLGQVLINVGYTIYFKLEREGKKPPGKMDDATARKLEKEDSTLGSMIMRLGFDFQGPLLESLKEQEERKL